jgi:3-hydroxybutyryl-CoA dehydratase
VNAAEVAPVVRQLSQDLLNRYAEASADHNPIHIDEEFARTTPFGGTIAHGMLVLAVISQMMTAAFGERWFSSGTLDVRFRSPARPADRVTSRAVAVAGAPEGRQRYNVECTNQAGELLISGMAEVDA